MKCFSVTEKTCNLFVYTFSSKSSWIPWIYSCSPPYTIQLLHRPKNNYYSKAHTITIVFICNIYVGSKSQMVRGYYFFTIPYKLEHVMQLDLLLYNVPAFLSQIYYIILHSSGLYSSLKRIMFPGHMVWLNLCLTVKR